MADIPEVNHIASSIVISASYKSWREGGRGSANDNLAKRFRDVEQRCSPEAHGSHSKKIAFARKNGMANPVLW